MKHQAPTLSVVLQVIAIFWLGIMAGFFATYSGNVSLATQTFDGPLYATVQSALNRHVRHPAFFAFFFLPPVWAAGSLMAGWRSSASWGWWLSGAAVLYTLGIIVFTREVNLPLNAYTESWNPGSLPPDWRLTRDQWTEANALRTAVSGAAFLLGLVSLALRTGPVRSRFDRRRSW